MHRRLLLAALLALSLAFMACGGDDDKGGTSPNLNTDEGLTAALLNDLVIPLMERINFAAYLEYLPAEGASLGFAQCQDLMEGCTSGSAQLCPVTGGFQIQFTDCVAGGTRVNGTVTITGSPTEGTGSVAISLDDAAVSGDVVYTVLDNCIGISVVETSVTMPNVSAVLNAYIEFCTPPATVGDNIVPNYATFFVTVPARNRFIDVIVFRSIDGDYQDGEYEIVVLPLDSTEYVLACHGVLYGDIDCWKP